MPQRSLDQDFAAEKIKSLTADIWNQHLRSIELRFKRQENREPIVDAALANLRQVGLDRINEVLTPAIVKINKVSELGFLMAASVTPHVMPEEPGDTMLWTVTAGDQRDLFQPAPFCIVQAVDDPDTWALIHNAGYTRLTGALYGEIWFVSPSADTETAFDDWSIGALAGSTMAQMALLQQGQAAASQAAADKATVAADKATVAGHKADVAEDKGIVAGHRANVAENAGIVADDKAAAAAAAATAVAAAASIAGGPVANVAGLTGSVSAGALKEALEIEPDDIEGLPEALTAATDGARGFGIAMALYF